MLLGGVASFPVTAAHAHSDGPSPIGLSRSFLLHRCTAPDKIRLTANRPNMGGANVWKKCAHTYSRRSPAIYSTWPPQKGGKPSTHFVGLADAVSIHVSHAHAIREDHAAQTKSSVVMAYYSVFQFAHEITAVCHPNMCRMGFVRRHPRQPTSVCIYLGNVCACACAARSHPSTCSRCRHCRACSLYTNPSDTMCACLRD